MFIFVTWEQKHWFLGDEYKVICFASHPIPSEKWHLHVNVILKTQYTYLCQFLRQQLLQPGFVVILLDKVDKVTRNHLLSGFQRYHEVRVMNIMETDVLLIYALNLKICTWTLNSKPLWLLKCKYFHILLRDKAILQNLTYKHHEESTFRCCHRFQVTNLMTADLSLIYSKNWKRHNLVVNRKHLWILMYCFSWYFSMWLRDFGWKTNSNLVRAKHCHFWHSPDRRRSVN